jgi:CheY-like chemotaxis protein
VGQLLTENPGAKKVLVVEDHLTVRALTDDLRNQGYSVCVAQGRGQCLEKVRQEQPDVIILDAVSSERADLISRIRQEETMERVRFILLGVQATEEPVLVQNLSSQISN